MSLIGTLETHLGLALKAQGITAGGLLGLKSEYKLPGVQRALWGQRSARRWVAWHRFSGCGETRYPKRQRGAAGVPSQGHP